MDTREIIDVAESLYSSETEQRRRLLEDLDLLRYIEKPCGWQEAFYSR